MGCDLVEVTAHAGARPEHAEWQGKVYSRSGKSKKYPDLVEVTGYGTGPGLGGWNCRHSMFPFYENISTRTYNNEELEELKEDGKIKLRDNNNITNNSYKDKNIGKSQYLNNSSKKLCNDIYNAYKQNGYENISLISTLNDKQISDIYTIGKKDIVKLSIKQENLLALQDNRSVLIIHNHPNNDTFSKSDIKSMIENRKICGIIATGVDYNYFLEINEKELKKTIMFKNIWEEVLIKVNEIIKNDVKNVHLLTNEVMHNIYVDVFTKRGWNYGRERRL